MTFSKKGSVMKTQLFWLLALGWGISLGLNHTVASESTDLLADGMQLNDQWVITDGVLSPSENPGGIIWS